MSDLGRLRGGATVEFNLMSIFYLLLVQRMTFLVCIVHQICLTRGDTQLVLPLVYDMQSNVTQLADKRDSQPHLIAVSLHLKR